MKRLVLVLVVMMMFASPVYAQSGCEIAHECGEGSGQVNPTGQPVTSLYVWDPISGYAHNTGSYGLAAFCYNYGGYYYMASDGAWYWFAC